MAAAYAELIAEAPEGVAISGRALASRARCARPAANEWLQVHQGGSDTSGSESTGTGPGSKSSGPGAGTTGSDEVDLILQGQGHDTGELVARDLEVDYAS